MFKVNFFYSDSVENINEGLKNRNLDANAVISITINVSSNIRSLL